MTVGAEYELLHAGLTRYHHYGMIVPVLAAVSPMLWARLNVPGVPQSVNALVGGTLTFAAAYVLLRWALRENHALGKAVLLGLLVAEFTVFTSSTKVPSIVNIFFYIFMYFYGLAELSSHWKK